MSLVRRSNVLDPFMGSAAFDPFSMDLWDPFSTMFGGGRSLVPTSTDADTTAFVNARMDWRETPEAHVFKADLPGVRKEEVKVEVEDGNVLVISGQRAREKEDVGGTWHRVERSSGSFLRRFRLPDNAMVDQVRAGLENGVLTVTVPKVDAAKRPALKSIQISGIYTRPCRLRRSAAKPPRLPRNPPSPDPPGPRAPPFASPTRVVASRPRRRAAASRETTRRPRDAPCWPPPPSHDAVAAPETRPAGRRLPRPTRLPLPRAMLSLADASRARRRTSPLPRAAPMAAPARGLCWPVKSSGLPPPSPAARTPQTPAARTAPPAPSPPRAASSRPACRPQPAAHPPCARSLPRARQLRTAAMRALPPRPPAARTQRRRAPARPLRCAPSRCARPPRARPPRALSAAAQRRG
ncbi:hypothetical protein EJB05_02776, partial [Eragrostis curvula]